MKNKFALALIMALLFVASSASAQIPTHPNKTDTQGNRQGKWTILFDENWKPVADTSSAAYFRLIEYKNDKPIGLVKEPRSRSPSRQRATSICKRRSSACS